MEEGPDTTPNEPPPPAEASEMVERVQEMDWTRTALGPMDRWPGSLRTALDMVLSAPHPMALWWGPELTLLYNDAYAPLLGSRHPGALGRSGREVWSDAWPKSGPIAADVLRRGESVSRERDHFVLTRHGEPEDAWFTWSFSPVRDDAGAIAGILNIALEDTAAVRAEAARRTGEERLRALVGATGAVLYRMSADWSELLPLDGKGLVASNDAPLRGWMEQNIPASEHDAIRERIAQCRADGSPFDMEHRVFRPDGSVGWTRSRAVPVPDEAGVVIEWVGTAEDVTERRAAEAALRDSEERFRQLADAMPQIFFSARPDGTVDYFNRRWYEYTGFARDSDPGDWVEVHTEEGLRRVRDVWSHSLRTGEPYEIEYLLRRHDGAYRWHLARALPVRDREGTIVRWFGTNTDIHDHKEAQVRIEQLLDSERAARAEADRVNRTKDEFLATLSHELRTPLNAIYGWSQMLLGSPTMSADIVRQGLETIERNARAQTEIIEDLLDMSRIVSGRVRLDQERTALPPVIEAAVETVRHAADEKGIRLETRLGAEAGPVRGDPARLQQVFWNLLSNAVKFTPPGGRVTVELSGVGTRVDVSVTDTGEGIAADLQANIFDRFRQADSSSTRRHGGLGLGLAIARQLVELHGGTLRVESPGIGEGSTFTVSLPLLAALSSPNPGTSTRNDRHLTRRAGGGSAGQGGGALADLTGVRVLVVDDEPDARELLRRLLEERGARVAAAGSAFEAIERVQQETPDVLLTDIGMPDEDGYTLLERIRALGPEAGGDVPAVAVSAYARSSDRARSLQAGFQTHIAKPVEPAELIATVARLTRRA